MVKMDESLDLSQHGAEAANSQVGRLLKQFPKYYVKNIFAEYIRLGPKFQVGFHKKSAVYETEEGVFYGYINASNERSGKGLLIKTDGSIVEASFYRGQMMGQGRLITQETRIDGNWVEDKMTEGLIELNEEELHSHEATPKPLSHSNSVEYRDKVKDKKPLGEGMLTEPEVIYEDYLENVVKVSKGTYRHEDGR
jgi:hypothetical protein